MLKRRREKIKRFKSIVLTLLAALFLVLPTVAAADYASVVAADSPTTWWRFEGNLDDSSVNNRPATFGSYTPHTSGPEPIPGTTPVFTTSAAGLGSAIVFDEGDGSWENIEATLPVNGSFSAELWAKSKFHDKYFGDGTFISAYGPTNDFLLYPRHTTKTVTAYNDWGTIWQDVPDVTIAGDVDVWRHFVVTYDNAEGERTFRLYVDGALASERFHGMVRSDTPLDLLVAVGRYIPITGKFDYGFTAASFDEFAIYDYALTLQQIQQHYASAVPGVFDGNQISPDYANLKCLLDVDSLLTEGCNGKITVWPSKAAGNFDAVSPEATAPSLVSHQRYNNLPAVDFNTQEQDSMTLTGLGAEIAGGDFTVFLVAKAGQSITDEILLQMIGSTAGSGYEISTTQGQSPVLQITAATASSTITNYIELAYADWLVICLTKNSNILRISTDNDSFATIDLQGLTEQIVVNQIVLGASTNGWDGEMAFAAFYSEAMTEGIRESVMEYLEANYAVARNRIEQDLNGDGTINLLDYAVFSCSWKS